VVIECDGLPSNGPDISTATTISAELSVTLRGLKWSLYFWIGLVIHPRDRFLSTQGLLQQIRVLHRVFKSSAV
jgi:hypothetical protein